MCHLYFSSFWGVVEGFLETYMLKKPGKRPMEIPTARVSLLHPCDIVYHISLSHVLPLSWKGLMLPRILVPFLAVTLHSMGFPGGSVVKNPPANAGNASSIPELGISPGGGHGNPLQYSCMETPWTKEPVGYSLWGCKSRTQMSGQTTPQVKRVLIPVDTSILKFFFSVSSHL